MEKIRTKRAADSEHGKAYPVGVKIVIKEEPLDDDILHGHTQVLREECMVESQTGDGTSDNSDVQDPLLNLAPQTDVKMENLGALGNGIGVAEEIANVAGSSATKRKHSDANELQDDIGTAKTNPHENLNHGQRSGPNVVPPVTDAGKRRSRGKVNVTSNQDRERVIAASDKGYSHSMIAEMLGIKRPTVYSILKKYWKTGEVEANTRGGVKPKKLTDAAISSIQAWLDEDCTISLSKLVKKVWEHHQIQVSHTTIAREFYPFYYSFKRIKVAASSKRGENTESTVQDLLQYISSYNQLVQRLPRAAIIFVHAVALNVNLRTTSQYSPEMANKQQSRPAALRTRNVVIICAMNRIGLIHYTTRYRPINQPVFEEFLKDMTRSLNYQHDDGHRPVLILNGDAFRGCATNSEAIAQEGYEVQYLPRNAPAFNPIDSLIDTWKQIMKRANPQNEAELMAAIERGASFISDGDCKECFNKMDEFLNEFTIKKQEMND
uniref:DDE_3 domain-containing protein n=1 Tax=Anopheles coluzzii TaxID=1518534 RepID=A0A6E8WAS5_ANOCL|nr:uncharacterized protein LOC120951038 isoform X1 [Anopheles coluzzii]